MQPVEPIDLIEAKKAGLEHDPTELGALVEGFLRGDVPDYQMAAWLMAVRWQGLSRAETLELTQAYVRSGSSLDLAQAGLPPPYIDKHSTGGVGDKLTLVVLPLLLAADATVVKVSGRGLGHTGGTIDKLAAIPGFNSEFERDALMAVARRAGGCVAAQTPDMVPADGLIYALRDVTCTVDSLPLIAASIMSKKLAAGARTIGLDVKVGSGAFMRDLSEAAELARLMVDIAAGAGRRAVAVLTGMDEPLGNAIGNAIEVNEALAVLGGRGPAPVRDLALDLAAEIAAAADLAPDRASAHSLMVGHLASGRALERWLRLLAAQGCTLSEARLTADEALPLASLSGQLRADRSGQLEVIDARAAGFAAVALGAGRRRKADPVDPGAGIRLLVRSGDQVQAGQVLAELYASDAERLARGIELARKAFRYRSDTVDADEDAARRAGEGAEPAAKPLPGRVLRVIGG